jgi:hypothetical protein
MTAQLCLKPGGEIHRAVWGRYADVAQIASGVACWKVHAATECDGEVCVITADTCGPQELYSCHMPRVVSGSVCLYATWSCVQNGSG